MSERLSHVIRRKFVDYFALKHGHKFVPSSNVIPHNDKSLTFVSAGMTQFKSLFLADLNVYPDKRICNYQKCIRVNDLDLVGRSPRHHTFFEMLGNWSFNDYGREEACEWALDFLVNHLNLDQNKFSVTYHSTRAEEDTATRAIWERLGLPSKSIQPNASGDNFWEMGSSGPCGMSTELFYPLNGEPVEVWNLVFIDRFKDETDGKTHQLKSKFVDTGMGLERILAAVAGVNSNYETDLFKTFFDLIQKKSNARPYREGSDDQLDVCYRKLADFSRMITIAIADDLKPGRKGAPFHLRTVVKQSLGMSSNVFDQKEDPRYLLFDLVEETVEILKPAYPELPSHVKKIMRTLAREQKHYRHLTEKGVQKADASLPNSKGDLSSPNKISPAI